MCAAIGGFFDFNRWVAIFGVDGDVGAKPFGMFELAVVNIHRAYQ